MTQPFSPSHLPYGRILFLIGAALALGSSLLAATTGLYTCGMHPSILRKEPGDCPICEMKLQPVKSTAPAGSGRKTKYYKSKTMPGEMSPMPGNDTRGVAMVLVDEEDAGGLSTVTIDSRTIQRMNLKTAVVVIGPVRREIRAVGTVTYDEQGLREITTKYEGWIEKLHVTTSWATVKAGDPLFDIYSPELYKAQLSYLMASRSEGSATGQLTKASLSRLQLYDLSDEFLSDLLRNGEARPNFTYRSPVNGTVIEKMGVAGQMMKSGERIFRIADLSSVWVLAQIYESDLPLVHAGQPAMVKLTYGSEKKFDAKIAVMLPQVDERTHTATARLIVPNPDGILQPGMFVDLRFTSEIAPAAVLVPDAAVLRSGERNTVFVALAGGAFEPREIKLGVRGEGNVYQVIDGLSPGERVVTSGQFMLDSESQLQEAIQKMVKSSEVAPVAQAVSGGADHR